MRRTLVGLLPILALTGGPAAPAGLITRTVGRLSVIVDQELAYQGGLFVVHLRPSLATTFAVFNGRKVPFYNGAHGPRALVPIPVYTPPGPAILGIELMTRRGGRQRIAIEVAVTARAHPTRSITIPEAKRGLLSRREGLTDGRRVLSAIWASSPIALWNGGFLPPLAASPSGDFGCPEADPGGPAVDSLLDATYGEYHRGIDYEVPPGTPVVAPAAAIVVLANHLLLSGGTLVLDHGQGVVSVFFHLSRIEVREGDRVEARAVLGQVGDSGIAAKPHLHWGTYLHSVAVDPGALLRLLD